METSLIFNEDTFSLGVPFVKVNTKTRTVSGFATLDNIDQAGEILDSAASKEAFRKWIGNIREMHQKKAVGKAIDIVEKQYEVDGTTYNGIYITAKISKGAEDTWQKVLDGTLAGFSVGGAVFEKERGMVKSGDTEREVWIIKKYALNEVSLVDSPCNQLALVSLVKSIDGVLEVDEDLLADTEVEVDELEKGYIPHGDFVDYTPELSSVVAALEGYRDAAIAAKDDRTASHVSETLAYFRCKEGCETEEANHIERNKKIEEALGKDLEVEGETMEKTEEGLQNNETSDNSSNMLLTNEEKGWLRKLAEKILGDKPTSESEGIVPTEEVVKEGDVTSDMNTEGVEELVKGQIEGLSSSVDEKFNQIGESLVKVTEALEAVAKSTDLDELKTELEGLKGRLEVVETSGGMKKSNDDASEEKLEKSTGFWSDSIVPEFLKKNTK
jgi:phage head maturation protease/polyhydroxyalkanoate synthesis regulator phasin